MYKNIIVLLIFFGILLMTISITKNLNNNNEKEIVYKYIEKPQNSLNSFTDFPSDIFDSMFEESSPWINSINELDEKALELLKKYHISQYS